VVLWGDAECHRCDEETGLRERFEDAMLLVLKVEEPTSQGMQVARKNQSLGSPLEPSG
jgi:hypothetical protein